MATRKKAHINEKSLEGPIPENVMRCSEMVEIVE